MKTPPMKIEASIPRTDVVERKRLPSGELSDDGRAIKKEKVDHYEESKDVPRDTSLELKVKADDTLKRVNELIAKRSLVFTGPPKYLTDEEIKKIRHNFL